jgi:hypothetical protein
MAKQKLKDEQVEMIKYLYHHKKSIVHQRIADMVGCSRVNICRIGKGHRWREIQVPDIMRGEYLYLKYLNGEMK